MRGVGNHLILPVFLALGVGMLAYLFLSSLETLRPDEADEDTGKGWISAENADMVTVFAPSSLTETVGKAARRFEAKTGAEVRVHFASSSALARQIESGGPADVFISANRRWMDYLEGKELILPDSRRDLLGNVLAVVTWRGSEFDRAGGGQGFELDAVLLEAGRIAVAEPYSAPVGIYARQALQSMGLYEQLRGRFITCSNARTTLMTVQSGQAPLGIVYTTDAAAGEKTVLLGTFDPAGHDPILYSAAKVVGGGPKADVFLAYLHSNECRDIFVSAGFSVSEGAQTSAGSAAAGEEAGRTGGSVLGPLGLSLKVSLLSMSVLVVPGVALGYVLARKDFPGKAVLSAMIHVPLVIPPVVTGYLLLTCLGPNTAIGRTLDRFLGVELAFTPAGAVVASAVVALPLMVRSVRVSMELIDRRIEQASRTLGASPVRTFLTVTLPLALPGLIAGMILSFARSMGEFGATITFAGNIENMTRTLPLAVFTHLESPSGQSAAMTLVMISVAVSTGAVLLSEAFTVYARRIYGDGYAS